MKSIHYLTILALAFAFVVILTAISHGEEREVKGFDYYILSMSWSPEFCRTHDFAEECKPPHNFILHGLWPQYEDGGYPHNCRNEYRVPDTVIEDMMTVMPNRHLIIHEWQKHGSCTGLEPSIYFQNAKDTFNSITIPEVFKNMANDLDTNSEGVINVFMAENPGLKPEAIQVVCDEDEMLNEVRFCLNKDGKSRACGEIHGTCRAQHLTIPAPAVR